MLLYTTQDEYTLLEGSFLPLLSEVLARHYPKVRLQYKLYVPRKHRTAEAIGNKAAKSLRKKKELDEIVEIQAGLNTAQAIIDNKFGLGDNGRDMLRDYFRKRYGGTPEEYIKRHQ